MFSTLAIVSLLSTAAFAQSSTAAASSTIPTGISSGCSGFLENLNKNSGVSSCASSIVSATADFSDPSTASSSSVSSALDNLCSSSDTCSSSTIRSVLADFSSSCSQELTSKNTEVIDIYDMLYGLVPFKSAVCSKDDNGSYCILSTPSSSLPTSAETMQQYLSTDSGAANMTTFSENSLPFLFLSDQTSDSDLCKSCTRKILTSYIQFMSDASYAPGISASVLLNKESSLYSKVTSTCGSAFLSGVVNAAGGIGTGSDDADTAFSLVIDFQVLAGAILGLAGVSFAL